MQALAAGAVEAMRAGRDDDAIRQFNEIVAKMPTCSDCYYNLGVAYAKKQQFDDAETSFKKAIELAPNSGDAYTGLANVYNAKKRFDLAQQASAKAAELSAASGGRRRRRGVLQPGRDPVERGQVRRGQGAVRGGGQGRPEHGDGALSARNGQPEPWRDSGGEGGLPGNT